MAELQDQLLFRHFGVVGHSMGGLVARGFILRYERLARVTDVPLFVSISTPWGGHSAASLGKRFARQVDVWRDLVPGSRYLRDLFTTSLPQATRYYLLFTFNRNKASLGTSDDHTVTVASQLVLRAQDEAVRTIGYDDTHAGVLFDANVANLLDALLDEAFQEGSP
jgi:pimeloyl-ACP methyl ester carboxylesterase